MLPFHLNIFKNMGFNKKVVARQVMINLEEELFKPGIQAIFFRDVEGAIYRFILCGHSNYGPRETDTLSSALAVLGINTVNAICLLTHAEADCICTEKQGVPYVECRIYRYSSKSEKKEVAILLNTLKLGLEGVQEKYGKSHITIKEVS